MDNLHDLYIYRYDVLCEKKEILFYLRDYDKKNFFILTICGVVTHHFNYVFSGNIVSSFVVRKDLVQFFDENKCVLSDYNLMGLDFPVKQRRLFVEGVRERKMQVFEVRSSYGLTGWVFGKECTIKKRSKSEGIRPVI